MRMYVCASVLADNMTVPFLLCFKAQEQRIIEGGSVGNEGNLTLPTFKLIDWLLINEIIFLLVLVSSFSFMECKLRDGRMLSTLASREERGVISHSCLTVYALHH